MLQGFVDNKINGLLLDTNGNFKRNWNFPKNMTVPDNYAVMEHRNGSMSIITKVDNFSWRITSAPLEEPISHGKKIIC